MDFTPYSSPLLLLSNEELMELYDLVFAIHEIDSEFIFLLEEELIRRQLKFKKRPINQ